MKWLEVEVIVKKDDADVASLILYELTGRGVAFDEQFSGGADRPASLSTASMKLKGYLPAGAAGKVGKIRAALAPYMLEQPKVRELPETDWLRSYRENYKHFRVGKHLVIKPPWEKYRPSPGDLVLTIDPGLAFGCGTHPTTRLCLELLEEAVRPGMIVYDVGTGSGILAIAAARLGAAGVVAVDNDELAVRAARENVALNGLEAIVHVIEGDLLKGLAGLADVIVANLTTEAIVGFVEEAARHLRPGGSFIASGIAAPREAEVKAVLEEFFSICKVACREDWAAFWALHKPGHC